MTPFAIAGIIVGPSGIRGLGQPLKSFRDRALDFPVYMRGDHTNADLNSVGSLVKPERGSRAALNVPADHQADTIDASQDILQDTSHHIPEKSGLPEENL